MQLAKFRYGRVVKVAYWVSHSSSQGVFPKWALSKPCEEDEVDGGKTFWAWGSSHTRVRIVSFMGAFVEGVLHLRFQCNLFPSPLFAIN